MRMTTPLMVKGKNLEALPEPKNPIPPHDKTTPLCPPQPGGKDETIEIRISVEFGIPKDALAVNVPQLFKSLLQKMFTVDNTMTLLHWVLFDGNAITRPSDVPTDIETLAPIFAGVKVQSRSGIVKGVFKITT